MAFINATTLMTSDQILHSFQYLAAMSAGILFLIEGGLMAIMVFSGGRIPDR